MLLDNLRNIILNERESARLTEIQRDTFESAHRTLSTLRTQVYEAEDPLSEEARSLSEEIFSLRETVQDLLQIRSRKILALAGTRIDQSLDREEMRKMLPAEQEMYRRIREALEEYRRTLTEGTPPAVREEGVPEPAVVLSESEEERMVVRMLSDVDSFLGVDGRIYTLKKEDVVTLPRINAEVLCVHNIALNIKPGT